MTEKKTDMVLTATDKRKIRLIRILNAMWGKIVPAKYEDMNYVFKPLDSGDFEKLEKRFPELVCKVHDGVLTTSMVGLMATITEVMCGDRLGLIMNSDTGVIDGFDWHSNHPDKTWVEAFDGDKIDPGKD